MPSTNGFRAEFGTKRDLVTRRTRAIPLYGRSLLCSSGGSVQLDAEVAERLEKIATRPRRLSIRSPRGMVENLVKYAKRDLMVPQQPFGDLAAANTAAVAWCTEVNAAAHSEIAAVPAAGAGST